MQMFNDQQTAFDFLELWLSIDSSIYKKEIISRCTDKNQMRF